MRHGMNLLRITSENENRTGLNDQARDCPQDAEKGREWYGLPNGSLGAGHKKTRETNRPRKRRPGCRRRIWRASISLCVSCGVKITWRGKECQGKDRWRALARPVSFRVYRGSLHGCRPSLTFTACRVKNIQILREVRMRHVCFSLLKKSTAFALAVFLMASALPCVIHAKGAAPDEGNRLQVKNVIIKGTKVRLPIPEGYEEMRREDDPERYDWMVGLNSDEESLPLAYLINSEDKATLKRGERVNLRYGFAYAHDHSWDAVIASNSLLYDREYFKKYIKELRQGIAELDRADGEDPKIWGYIYDGRKSISYFWVSRNKAKGKNYKYLGTKSFVVLDRKVAIVVLYLRGYEDSDVAALKKITIEYLEKIDRGRF